MFPKKAAEEKTALDLAIDELLSEMVSVDGGSEEYTVMANNLVKLHSLKPQAKRVSADTKAAIAGNLVGILLIVTHERTHVITTKALSFIRPTR